jgi:hypothetical protein
MKELTITLDWANQVVNGHRVDFLTPTKLLGNDWIECAQCLGDLFVVLIRKFIVVCTHVIGCRRVILTQFLLK